jgi:hypothetical protein
LVSKTSKALYLALSYQRLEIPKFSYWHYLPDNGHI